MCIGILLLNNVEGSNLSVINKYRVDDPVFIYWRWFQSVASSSPNINSLIPGKIQGSFTIFGQIKTGIYSETAKPSAF